MSNKIAPSVASMMKLKGSTIPVDAELPIFGENCLQIGTLRLFTAFDLNNEEVIRDLTDWRNRYMSFFFTQFTATENRTREWLSNIVLQSNERLLFLITLPEGDCVGNFGVCNICNEYCELDNLIRGRRGGGPTLINRCEISLLNWIFTASNIGRVTLRAFSDNHPTLRLHLGVGFKLIDEYPLMLVKDETGVKYVPNSDASTATPNCRRCTVMEIQKDTFFSLYPNFHRMNEAL